ncbi:MAG TPA: ABC transporter ATP-binding protein [Acidobacteriota bacterium]
MGAGSEPLVQLRGVSKGFVEGGLLHPVLEGVDLDVATGEIVTLLGRSGSGKSTLLNLIGGIDVPDAGRVVIGGTDMTRAGERQRTLFRRRHIGFVFQFFNLLPTLTVEENVMLPLQLNGMEGAGERARELLARVGLEGRAGSFPDRLSGGEQQRVAIARALAHDPELILADEPTGNLDAGIGLEVLELLCGLAGAAGKTLLIATHSHEVAERGDRILRIVEHDLVEVSGRPA